MDPTPVLDQPERFKLTNRKLIPLSNSKLCVTITKDFSNVGYEICHPSLEKRQTWIFENLTGKLFSSIRQTILFPWTQTHHYCVATKVYPITEQLEPTLNITDCTNIDYNLQLRSDTTKLYGKWKLQEVTEEIESEEESQVIESPITDEASHHQYNSGTFIEISNILNDEIRNIYCESLLSKQFLAMTMAHSSPMLAGILLGLPLCQRVQADGQTMLIQQCKPEKVTIGAQKTKCGWEPKWDEYTIGSDGYTRRPFHPCTWSNGLVNFNGKTYEFTNNTWQYLEPNIKIGSIGLKSHFEETPDVEAQYLRNLETSFHSKEIEQISVISELMAIMKHDEINSISPIIVTKQEKSNLKNPVTWFSRTLSTITWSFLTIIFTLLYCFCCRNRDTKPLTLYLGTNDTDNSPSNDTRNQPTIDPHPTTPDILVNDQLTARSTSWTRADPPLPLTPKSGPTFPMPPTPPPTPTSLANATYIKPIHKPTTLHLTTTHTPPETTLTHDNKLHINPKYILSKGYCWQDGCQIFAPSLPTTTVQEHAV
jgi:hypothetical protein